MKRSTLPQPTKRRAPAAPASPSSVSTAPQAGQCVEVTGGQLIGLRGLVVSVSGDQRCVIKLDHTVAGVLLTIHRKWLRAVAQKGPHKRNGPKGLGTRKRNS